MTTGNATWATAATFWTPTEAQIARLRLESDGIRVVILDENLVANEWQLANAIGGIKLQVPAIDLSAARSSLARARDSVVESDEPVSDGQDLCPRCGSPDIYGMGFSRRWSMVALFVCPLLLPFAFGRRTRCSTCGYEWR